MRLSLTQSWLDIGRIWATPPEISKIRPGGDPLWADFDQIRPDAVKLGIDSAELGPVPTKILPSSVGSGAILLPD